MTGQTQRMRRSATRSVTALIAACALAGGLAACGDDDDDTGSDDPGSLTVYSGREEEYVGPLVDRYKEETGVDIEIRYGESAELAATIVEEGENSPADVFFSQDAGSLGALQQEDLMQPLDEEILELVDERFRSSEGDWVGTSGRARAVAYNTEAVSESDLPESVLEFTDAEWEGRVAWAPTNGSFQAFVTAMRLTEGDDATRAWLDGIVANDPVSYPDNEALRDGIAAGEADVGFINHYYVAEAIEEEGEGYPVSLYFPPNGDVGSLVNVAGAGVLVDAENAETGADFIEWLLAEPQQEYFADAVKEYPLVEEVEADPTLIPLAEIEQPDVDLADLGDLKETLTMIEESGAL